MKYIKNDFSQPDNVFGFTHTVYVNLFDVYRDSTILFQDNLFHDMNIPDPPRISDAYGLTIAINDTFRNMTADSLTQWIGYGDIFYSLFSDTGTVYDNVGANYQGLMQLAWIHDLRISNMTIKNCPLLAANSDSQGFFSFEQYAIRNVVIENLTVFNNTNGD